MKPDNSYHYSDGDDDSDSYIQDLDRFYFDSFAIGDERTLLFEEDRYEIFAFCAESRSNALGAVRESVAGMTEFNLRDAPLRYNGERYSHNRQFKSNIIAEDQYWRQFVENCELVK